MSTPQSESLDYAERWMRDSLAVLRAPVSIAQISVDMTNAMKRLEAYRKRGAQLTATHLLVRAVANTLASNPALHQLIAGRRRRRPENVDIGLSISGESFVAPVIVIEGANKKSPIEIAEEIARRVPEVQAADRKFLDGLRRWGWLVPFGFLRRALLARQFGNPAFRRRVAGTFQISTVPVDWALTTTLVTAGVLIAGRVWPRVIAVDGQAAVRPTMSLTLSGDHGVWDGRAATRFLAAVQTDLESEPEATAEK
jgi:pyruvate/2-oxoglutarate dehydrogenase complex dihydrolipoamide acyltransferase (E2) component